MRSQSDIKKGAVSVKRLGQQIDIKSLSSELNSDYQPMQFRDSIMLHSEQGAIFVFDYGIVVTWDIDADTKTRVEERVASFVSVPDANASWESFTFGVNPDAAFSLENDVLSLEDTERMVLLAISHGFAQSSKLDYFESLAEHIIIENRYLTEELTKTGKIPLSRKELAQLRGKLFQSKNDILLRYSLLDTPEFFWDYPELEDQYQVVAKYFDLTNRVELLTLKLETIQQLLDMLAGEQNHKHSAFLEWIIIVLIAIDILIYFQH